MNHLHIEFDFFIEFSEKSMIAMQPRTAIGWTCVGSGMCVRSSNSSRCSATRKVESPQSKDKK